jgi:hypothetical protein
MAGNVTYALRCANGELHKDGDNTPMAGIRKDAEDAIERFDAEPFTCGPHEVAELDAANVYG